MHFYQYNILHAVVDPSVPKIGRGIGAMKGSSIWSSNEFLTSGHTKIAQAVFIYAL